LNYTAFDYVLAYDKYGEPTEQNKPPRDASTAIILTRAGLL